MWDVCNVTELNVIINHSPSSSPLAALCLFSEHDGDALRPSGVSNEEGVTSVREQIIGFNNYHFKCVPMEH